MPAVPQPAHSQARQVAWVPQPTCLVLLASQGRPEGGIPRPRLSTETFVIHHSPPPSHVPSLSLSPKDLELEGGAGVAIKTSSFSLRVPEAIGVTGTEGEDKF